ncbi:Rieske (2Fe-2S) protein [Phaeobacter italicus]|uniref:Rieske (2Fe-2S) protein n=1 Tax=Phaeobacter italicus TaxID=481446 RepID=UPI00248E7238|nr:Rieske (2Fe-2S) protein [Phaeobacter italicus]
MGRHVICRAEDIAPGSSKRVEVEGREIAVFNTGAAFRAVTNRCPHEGADLCRGRIAAFVDADAPGAFTVDEDRVMVRCPWHGWEFDLETGRSYCDPNRVRVKPFEVNVQQADGRVEGKYSVETFPVEAEGEYLVLTI